MSRTSERTKSLIYKKRLFGIISFCLFIATALFFIITAFCKVDLPKSEGGFIDEDLKSAAVGISTTSIICIIGVIIIRDKIRIFVWMVTLILAVLLYDKVGMFIVLGIWAIDEYVFYMIYKRYKRLVEINKEIDLR